MNSIKFGKSKYHLYFTISIFALILGTAVVDEKSSVESTLFIGILAAIGYALGNFIQPVPHLKSIDEKDGVVILTPTKGEVMTFKVHEVNSWYANKQALNMTINNKTYVFLCDDGKGLMRAWGLKKFGKPKDIDNKGLMPALVCVIVFTMTLMRDSGISQIVFLVISGSFGAYFFYKIQLKANKLPKSEKPVNIKTSRMILMLVALAFGLYFSTKDIKDTDNMSSNQTKHERIPASEP